MSGGRESRRDFLWRSGGGLGGIALASLLGGETQLSIASIPGVMSQIRGGKRGTYQFGVSLEGKTVLRPVYRPAIAADQECDAVIPAGHDALHLHVGPQGSCAVIAD